MGLNSPLSAQRRAAASAILSGGGPKSGDRVMFCAHADISDDGIQLPGMFHWHRFVPTPETVENDTTGETFQVEWFAVCAECQTKFPDLTKALAQDTEWIGQSPNITRVI